MPPLFNIIRTCVLATVCVFTIIVLSLAAHFLNVLESSDQTNYVPLAIFTATATLFIMSALWIGSCARKPHPIFQTKYELAWLAGLGILWLSLGAYTVSLDEVEVECFDDNGVEVDSLDGFSTDVYHAQYHAIQAFSILNALLLLGLFLLLLFLAIRRNRADPRRPVWAIPATMVNWFGQGRRGPRHEKSDSHTPLPPPITARFTIARRAELAKGDDDDDVTKSKPKLDMKEKFVSAAPMLARTFNFGRGDRDRDRSSDEEEGRGRDRRRDRERSQERDRERQRERQLAEKLERDRERDRNRERELAQVYDRELERERERARERERQRDRSRERERAREREQELDRPPSRTPQRSGTIPPRSATTAGNVVGRNWQAPQRTLTIPPRGPPRDAPTTSRPTADVQAPPAARTRQTPGRSRTIPARNLPTTNTTRQPAAPTPIADAFKSSRDRDLPSPPPADPPTSRSAPLRSTTRDRAAPPATSSRTRTGATTGATPTTQPAPRRSGR